MSRANFKPDNTAFDAKCKLKGSFMVGKQGMDLAIYVILCEKQGVTKRS
jgi:hypothetical protein